MPAAIDVLKAGDLSVLDFASKNREGENSISVRRARHSFVLESIKGVSGAASAIVNTIDPKLLNEGYWEKFSEDAAVRIHESKLPAIEHTRDGERLIFAINRVPDGFLFNTEGKINYRISAGGIISMSYDDLIALCDGARAHSFYLSASLYKSGGESNSPAGVIEGRSSEYVTLNSPSTRIYDAFLASLLAAFVVRHTGFKITFPPVGLVSRERAFFANRRFVCAPPQDSHVEERKAEFHLKIISTDPFEEGRALTLYYERTSGIWSVV